jgi:hypothetical protein
MIESVRERLFQSTKKEDALEDINTRITAMENEILGKTQTTEYNNVSFYIQRLNLELTKATQLLMNNTNTINNLLLQQRKMAEAIIEHSSIIRSMAKSAEIREKEIMTLREENKVMKKDRASIEIEKLKLIEKRMSTIETCREELINLCEKTGMIFKSIKARED